MRNRLIGLIVLAGLIAGVIAVRQETAVHAQATQTYNGYTVIPFTCRITAQTTTKECKALTAGLKTYVTDAIVTNNVATAQTLKIVTGTGTDCGGGQADLTHAVQFGAAVGNQIVGPSLTPLQPAAVGLAVCVAPSAATSYSATINGFVGP
jgi:hypothetical protein